jgi:hypothetical protein
MSKRKPSGLPADPRRSPHKSSSPAGDGERPPLVIHEDDLLAALEDPDVKETLERVHEARAAGAFDSQSSRPQSRQRL